MNLSKNFTLEEMTLSQEAVRSGLSNMPKQTQLASLKELCENILQPLRDYLRRPIVVSSGYRSRTINTRISGSKNSQHMKGEAADIIVPGMTVTEVIRAIRRIDLPFDKLIDEYDAWIHVSHSKVQRHEILKARIVSGEKVYMELK